MVGSRVSVPFSALAAIVAATLFAVTATPAAAERIKGSGTLKTETRSCERIPRRRSRRARPT